MDADQRTFRNPFSMDETCTNCDALADVRERVVHGYGDVAADFLFVGEAPSEGAERTGVPFTGDEVGRRVQAVLGRLGLSESPPGSETPTVENVYLTYLTRCRHPERSPDDREVGTCEPFLNAEIRNINPEILVPVGARALSELAAEYTTRSPDDLDLAEVQATSVRGRGFELVPMADPAAATDAELDAFVAHVSDLMGRDYRQTKGGRGRGSSGW